MSVDRAERIRELYQGFDDRDLDAVIAAMAPDVDWPNGWHGGRLVGREAVRTYWERQWLDLRPTITVRRVDLRPDGTVTARVRLVMRDPAGAVLSRSDVVHTYTVSGDLVQKMAAG